MNSIKQIPFEQLAFAEIDDIHKFIGYHMLTHKPWIFPQLLAYIAEEFKIPDRDATGKINGLEFLKINDSPRHRGIWKLFNKVNRSDLFSLPQTHESVLPYCTLVPLYMAAFKKYQGIKYSSWTALDHLVPERLLELMYYGPFPSVEKNRLLEIREAGLKGRNPTKFHLIYGLKDTELSGVYRLAVPVLFQIWCAHPVNRNEYMILDPTDWDNVPEPLVTTEVLISEKPTKSKKIESTPWD